MIGAVILGMTLATMATRFTPFILFSKRSDSPHLEFLGRYFPPGMMALLVLYCLKDVAWSGPLHGWQELVALAAVLGLHLKWRRPLLSIFLSTGLYMLLLRL
jgi:branched-subunit amino acid transport protein AzlD